MIQKLSHATIYVVDQDAARDFYVNKLGFEVRMDQSMDNGFRWLTVSPKGQPELQLILMKVDGPNIKPEVAVVLKGLVEQGRINGGVLQTDDCRATYEELKAKGVEFLSPPADRFYGVECILKDNSGNWFSMNQIKGMPPK
jgi:catechol 2,3-dioxygenase-like lactoylglutathione lyase family enzyme